MTDSGWLEVPFQEAIDFQEGPGILAKDFRESGVPLIRLAGLDSAVSVLEGCNYLDPGMVNMKWAHFALERGDILLSTSATLGRIAVVDENAEGSIPYTGIIRMRSKSERLMQAFIQYLLESPHFQRQAQMMGVGSVIRHFGPTHLRQMTVVIPPLPEQRRIAHILGTLDDKIDLNRRMNATLEAIARAIFKSWFVDFDPVWAKSEGSDTGLPEEIAALFPDSFEESELGLIPAGWEVKSLDEIANYRNGLALQNYPAEAGEDFLYRLKIRELRQGGFDDKSDRSHTDIPEDCTVYDGDVIFSWSGSLLIDLWTGGTCALNQHLFKVTSKEYPLWFYYFWTKYHLDEFQRIAAGKATTMGHIQRHHLSQAKTNVPPESLMTRAHDVINPFIEAVVNNRLEMRTLAELRDTLLPRLVSGELRV